MTGIEVVVALGANLGDRLGTLQAALDALAALPGTTVSRVSPVYETSPVGGPAGQPSYLNAVALLRTELTPRRLLEGSAGIESALGRVRAERFGPRVIDVDLLTASERGRPIRSRDPRLTLPHPRAAQRAFVLAPWHDVDPAALLPDHGPVAALLAAVGPTGVVRRDDLHLRPPAHRQPQAQPQPQPHRQPQPDRSR